MSRGRVRAIQSMTGYGRATRRTATGSITVELRSTNHRYLEIEQRWANGLSALQGRLTELLKQQIKRGRVEITVAVRLDRADQRRVVFDEPLLQRYHSALVELKGRFGLKGQVTIDHLLSLPQAFAVTEHGLPTEQLWEPVRLAAQAAVEEFVTARQREGKKLVADIRQQIHTIEGLLRVVKRRLPVAMRQQRRALQQRLRELLGAGAALSQAQLQQAAALIRDADVNEELVRLESHLTYMRQTLATEPLVGKRLDFIGQELMREANTLGAKVNDPEAAQSVVEMKGCVEKIREQVQNLE